MKSAQPPFSTRIGRMYSQASGCASAHSENTTPTGFEPTRLSKLSDPAICQIEPARVSISISWALVRMRTSGGRNWSMMRRPSWSMPFQIARRAWFCSGKRCQ
jgi:hypothetical protein